VHDSKSRERSTRALRSRKTTAVILLAGGAVVEGQIIASSEALACNSELSPNDQICSLFHGDVRPTRRLRVE